MIIQVLSRQLNETADSKYYEIVMTVKTILEIYDFPNRLVAFDTRRDWDSREWFNLYQLINDHYNGQ